MSLLEVLTIQMEADTGDLNKSIQKSEKSTDELIASLKKADKEADKAGSSFAGFAGKALGALTAALSVGTAISGVIGQATMITQLKQTSDALGVAVEDVDAFGKAAVAMGGDAQGARDSLTDMAESIGEALQDVESQRAKTFAGLKVSLKDVKGNAINAVEGILRLSDAVKGMSKEEAIFRIKELGITDNRTVEMVLKGRKELERLLMVQKQSGVVTKQQAEEAKKFTDTINILKSATSSAATGFMSSFIPALTQGVEWLTKIVEWAGEHKDFIVGFFTAVAGIVTAIYLPAMISAAAATLAATWPLIAIGAAIAAVAAAFALAYDDIMNFIDGNDSFIGQIFEKYPMIKQIVFAIINAFRLMGQTIEIIWDGIVSSITGAIDTVSGAISAVRGFFGRSAEEGRNITETGEMVSTGRRAMASASASPYNATTSGSISNSVATSRRETNVQVGEVIVQTQATDADGISKDIGGSLNDQLGSLDDEFSTGVDR